jgi:UDP-2,3-diacylglucosamine hydrolase
MKTLFFSDLHLDDSRPEAFDWLRSLLEGPARSADAVYILGDLFEYWIGDDAVPPLAARFAELTAALDREGVAVHFQHGNRDFLLGEDFAGQAGMRLMPEAQVVDLYGTPTLLMHGDSLCTDDTTYQAFRAQSRNPAWQAAVLARTVAERIAMAQEARTASADHTGSTSMEIMDVNEAAVQQAFAEHGVHRMIHGHTHRPATHRHELADGSTATRIVLADWYDRGSYLEVTPDGAVSREI